VIWYGSRSVNSANHSEFTCSG